MAITLYGVSGSPLVWRIWLALEHKELNYHTEWLSFLTGDLRKPEFLSLNPHGKVPVLTDEEFVLFETPAIIEYLDERYPQNNLLPLKPRDRAIHRRLISEIDCYLCLELRYLIQQLFLKPADEWDMSLVSQSQTQFIAELNRYEQYQQGEYLQGDLSIVDYSLYPIIATALHLEKSKMYLGIDNALGPKLRLWLQKMESLPFLDKTIPPHWRDN